MLASCDHSVHAYGTFGLWGSLLAGGDVIVSKGRSRNRLSEEDYIYREAAMPSWLYIDTSHPKSTRVLRVDEKTKQFVNAP